MPTIHPITPQEARTLLQKGEAVLIDVRELAEYKAGHIKGSTLIPVGDITVNHPKMPKFEGKKIIIHCKSGKRAQAACEKLIAEGLEQDLYNITGGIMAWEAANLPVATAEGFNMSLERQVHTIVGIVILTGITLTTLLGDQKWLLLSVIPASGLTFAGLTGDCMLARALSQMPWNK